MEKQGVGSSAGHRARAVGATGTSQHITGLAEWQNRIADNMAKALQRAGQRRKLLYQRVAARGAHAAIREFSGLAKRTSPSILREGEYSCNGVIGRRLVLFALSLL